MDNFLRGWLASDASHLDKIEVKRIYIDICDGNMYDAVLLSQIMYWHGNSKETGKPRLKVNRGGYLWLVKAHGDWWDECRVKESTAKQCLSRLSKLGVIIREYHRFNGLRTSHIRIDYDVLSKLIQSHISERHNISDRKDIMYPTEETSYIRPITDTTTDTTTEKKEEGRSSFFKVYEQNIGALTPMISDKIKSVIEDYPDGWFIEAVEIAVLNNKRSMNYIVKILENWLVDGKTNKHSQQPAQPDKPTSQPVNVEPPPAEMIHKWIANGKSIRDILNLMGAAKIPEHKAIKYLNELGVTA